MRTLSACLLVVLSAGCRCGTQVGQGKATIGTSPPRADFGPVKVGSQATLQIQVSAQTQAQLVLSQIAVDPPGVFTLTRTLETVPGLSSDHVELTFKPLDYAGYTADLVFKSNDPDRPELRLPISGEGAKPKLTVTPECAAAKRCLGTAVVTPPSLAFAPEPFVRLREIPATELPSVNLVNDGQVELVLSKLAIEGADAAAFTIQGSTALPAGGLVIGAQEGVSLPIRLKPIDNVKLSYSAQVVIESDDVDLPRVTVALTGTLRPNLPPKVCANLIKVRPFDDVERDFSGASDWAPLLIPPLGGYDFSLSRDVAPRAEAIFSAISNATDDTACTTDPEDGRMGLTYRWSVVSAPLGASSTAFSGATSTQATLRPIVTGEYQLELTVTDSLDAGTVVPIKMAVAVKQDLVAQLQWAGAADVDLDLHLVRPSAVTNTADPWSGVFGFFDQGLGGTSGDLNGFSAQRQKNTMGFDFEWGALGTADDPHLNLDDTGSGALVENASLNRPENDPLCATSPCTYKVLVHYFKDGRAPPSTSCTVDGGTGCNDGDACGCPGTTRCVANEAQIGAAASGVGKCFEPPRPVVRIFLKGSPQAAATIPLDTLVPSDNLALPAPCQMLYVAEVVWPAKADAGFQPDGGPGLATIVVKGADSTGRVVAPMVSRYGYRQNGALQCTRDDSVRNWYTQQP